RNTNGYSGEWLFMSLILDALNKADREREYRDAVPDLNTVHGAIRPPRPRHPAWMIGGLIAAVLMVVVLLVLLWLRQSDDTPVERATPESAAAPGQKSETLATTTGEAFGVAAALPDEEVRALYQPRQDIGVIEV